MEISTPKNKAEFINFGIREKGKFYWWASWYAEVLGYASLSSLIPSMDKAKFTCMQLGISVDKNFLLEYVDRKQDFKLTKFACFLISYHADGRKPSVRRARSFFLNELEEMNILLNNHDYLPRLAQRKQITTLNALLSKSARRAHVKDFRFFANEGYLGMYNHTMSELKEKRGLPKDAQLSDSIGLTELSANIFRITLTHERLQALRNPSEIKAAQEHWKIGSQIRRLIKENTGKYPEELPTQYNLKYLQRRLKKAQNELNKAINQKNLN